MRVRLGATAVREVYASHGVGASNIAQSLKVPILQVAYQLGLRYGEIVRLTWERVDLKRGLIGLTARDTKNKKPRTVPLTPELAEVLRDLYKVRYLGQDRVFLRNGQAISSVRKAFEKAKQRAVGRPRSRAAVGMEEDAEKLSVTGLVTASCCVGVW